MKIRLLHILWKGTIGGPERIILDLTRYLNLEKYEITVAILAQGGCTTGLIDRNKISVVEFGARSGKDIKAIRTFYKFLLSGQFHIIHCHEHSFFTNLLLAFLRPRPVLIYHEHGGFLLSGSIRTRVTYAFFARYYHAYIALHEEMVDSMVKASKACAKTTIVIENAVDLDFFKPLKKIKHSHITSENMWTIGMVGRLAPEKDLKLFIETAQLIIDKRSDVNFIIVGDGGMRSELQNETEKPEFKGKVAFLGIRSDVPDILNTFDLYLATSRIEGYGLAVIESLACSVPVVAAQLESGAGQIIYETYPGITLIRKRDARALAEMCISLLDDHEKRINLGQTGRAYVENHNSIQNYIKSVDNLYQRLFHARVVNS